MLKQNWDLKFPLFLAIVLIMSVAFSDGYLSAQEVGWSEDFSEIDDWRMTFKGGTLETDGDIATLKSVAKWTLYGTDINVDLNKYPYLCFKYRVVDNSGHPGQVCPWIWLTGTGRGRPQNLDNLIVSDGEWHIVAINIPEDGNMSTPTGDNITLIEINTHAPPSIVEWDWILFASEEITFDFEEGEAVETMGKLPTSWAKIKSQR